MVRSWILAVLLMGVICGTIEASGRNRYVRYQGNSFNSQYSHRPQYSFQSQYPVSYTTGTTQFTSSQSYSTGSQQIQPVSYQSTSGASFSQGDSMQAWAEEEARMMAERGTCGHIRPAPSGCFVGVGCGTTCMGSGTLVAEAHYQGKTVRVWRR